MQRDCLEGNSMKKAQPAHLGFDAKRLDRIVTWMESYVSAGKFPGSSLLICRDGHEVFHHATGLRSIETGKAFERDTVVRIYSMSKPVNSLAFRTNSMPFLASRIALVATTNTSWTL